MKGTQRKTKRVAVRLTTRERAKLDTLAKRSMRSPSAIVRLLLAQAEVGSRPDVRLKDSRFEAG